MLRKLHLALGLAGVLTFVLTGQYMHWNHAHLQGMPDGPRLLFRSSHIYLLWASLLNLALGCHLQRLPGGLARGVQGAGCVAVLLGPLLMCWSFFFESHHADLARPVARWAIYLALGGMALHVLASLLKKNHTNCPTEGRR